MPIIHSLHGQTPPLCDPWWLESGDLIWRIDSGNDLSDQGRGTKSHWLDPPGWIEPVSVRAAHVRVAILDTSVRSADVTKDV